METTLVSTILSYVPDNAIALVAVIALYIIISKQRSSTKTARDFEAESMRTEIALLKNEIERIKALDLEAKLAQILTDLAWLKDRLKENK